MGKIIALSGIDGSGKSTAGEMVKEILKENGIEDFKYVVTFDHFILKGIMNIPFIKKRFKKRRERVFDEDLDREASRGSTDKKEKKPKNRFLLFLWKYLVYVDIFLQLFYTKCLSRKVFVFDRYADDFYVSFAMMGSKGRFYRWLIRHFWRPHLHLYFHADSEVLVKRTWEEHHFQKEYFDNAKAVFDELFQYRNRLITIDTTKLPVNEVKEQLENILSQTVTKWKR